jgi:hypothetical protein
MFQRKKEPVATWAIAGGAAAAGASAAALIVMRTVRRFRGRADDRSTPTIFDTLEDAAVEALRGDPRTGVCAIDVAAVGPGVIELSGVVPDASVARHAAQLLQSVPGVRTVISRLEEGTTEERLARNRERLARGEPGLRDRRWYGVRVGTGQRRQSPATEPDRPDDSVQRRTRELEVGPAELGDSASSMRATGDFGSDGPPM